MYVLGPTLQCRVCAGDNCHDPPLVDCQKGDTSCSYQKTKGMFFFSKNHIPKSYGMF